uniref:Uncharacterized protein n=1 Tax=Glycine max TaxID=3847 RepID=A0A0R0KF03_SOYBN
MQSLGQNEAPLACPQGCCPTSLLFNPPPPPPQSQNTTAKPRNSSAECRHNFAATTTSSIFPNTKFTNHESLPSLHESFSGFKKVYPQYSETDQVDHVRAKEYYHLSFSNQSCLDYIGIGLFSYYQRQHHHDTSNTQLASSSTPQYSDNIPFFSISYKTGNLKTLLLHGGQESEFESAMRRRIMKFLNISDNDYFMRREEPRHIVAPAKPKEGSGSVEAKGLVESLQSKKAQDSGENGGFNIECRCLDQVDSLGLIMITNRTRYLINWLVNSMMKLKHPNAEGVPLVKIYGPKVKFDRGPALAFNVFDWKGEKVEPVLVQKLADRNNISLSYGFLHHVWFADKYAEDKGKVLQTKEGRVQGVTTNKKKDRDELGVIVVTVALSFLANFEDVYKLWTFVARFLDADFVEKERWRYTTLNQKTIEV